MRRIPRSRNFRILFGLFVFLTLTASECQNFGADSYSANPALTGQNPSFFIANLGAGSTYPGSCATYGFPQVSKYVPTTQRFGQWYLTGQDATGVGPLTPSQATTYGLNQGTTA
jgi:hypothetical protein